MHWACFLLCPVSFARTVIFYPGKCCKRTTLPGFIVTCLPILCVINKDLLSHKKWQIVDTVLLSEILFILFTLQWFTTWCGVLMKPPNVAWMMQRKCCMWLSVTANPPLSSSHPNFVPG